MPYQIGWFSTGRGEGSRELLTTVYNATQDGTIPGEIAFVFCSRERGEAEGSDQFMDLVEQYGIPLVSFSSRRFNPKKRSQGLKDSKKLGHDSETLQAWRIEYDREVMKRLDRMRADINVLAGYMLVTGAELCRRHTIINLHPAEPGGPKGMWREVIRELIETRAQRTGVMMHLVTEVLDEGPPITYCTFPIQGGDFDALWEGMARKLRRKSLAQIMEEEGDAEPLFAEIRRQGVIRELPLIVRTVKAFAEGRIAIEDRKVVSDGKVLGGAYDLTEEIDRIVGRS